MVPKPGFKPGQAYTHQTLNGKLWENSDCQGHKGICHNARDYQHIREKVKHGHLRETRGYFLQCIDQVLTKKGHGWLEFGPVYS